MKTQIIHLEPYDDIYSAKDKMGWGQTARILLVWPVRGRVLNRAVDLIMLKRHSADLGSQLAFVVQDADIKMHAQELGIPIFNSTRKAEKNHWRPERRQRSALPLTAKRQPMNFWRRRRIPMNLEGLRAAAHPPTPGWVMHPFTRVTAFTIGVLAVLAIAALLVPSAEIRLTPETQIEAITILVAANPEFQNVDLSGVVPAIQRTIIVEGRSSLPTSGNIPLPDQFSSGEVTFTNLTERSLPLPQGLVVTTLDDNPIRFQTTRSATVPPGEEGIIVPVEALSPGSAGNTNARKILAIEGPLGLDLIVINQRSTRGGSDQDTPAPSDADYQAIYEQLFVTLAASALDEIRAALSPGDLLLSQEASHIATLEESYTPATILPSDQLQLVLRLEFQALVVAGQDLLNLGQSALEANLSPGFSANQASLDIQHLNAPDLSSQSGSANWRMHVEWQTRAEFDTAQAIKQAIGRTPEQAEQGLTANLALDAPADIQLRPSWWPRLPFLPFRITVSADN
jgi:hypothetical protein